MDATVYEKRRVRGPATHAIVIGVGHYRHLPSGRGRRAKETWGLGQLSSPPHSAREIVRWLIEEYEHPTKPLGSVALLVAEASRTGLRCMVNGRQRSLRAAEATMAKVADAIRVWHQRGNASEDQLLLFFFCGHGFARGPDLALLLSDFAANPLAPLDGALDFRRFRHGMDECAAREQCYFVDACRTESDLLTKADFAGRPIVQATGAYGLSTRLRQAPVFHSTLAGAEAFAMRNRPSHFTTALVDAFAGAGSGDEQGPWQVRTNLLHDALSFMLRDASQRLRLPQAQINATDDLSAIDLNIVQVPQVPVVVSCEPDAANERASFQCTSASARRTRRPARGSWRLKLPVDVYDVAAHFPMGKYHAVKMPLMVRPTFRRVTLKVAP